MPLDASSRETLRGPDDLRPYQRAAIEWLRAHRYSALYLDMGLGKTIIVLTLLLDLFMSFKIERALIVAPLKVAHEVWPQEIAAWRHTRPITYRLLTGTREERHEAMRDRAAVHIIGRENFPWLVEAWGDQWPYDVLIWDESSRLRDVSSLAWKACKKIRPWLRRFHQLTGTPASQSYEALFGQVWLLDKGERLGSFVTHFRRCYFIENPWSHKRVLRAGADREIEAKIADICLVMKRGDHLDMEEPVVRTVPVRLDGIDLEAYRRFEREFILEAADGELIEAQTSAVLANKLLQLASGAVYNAERQARFFHDKKVQALHQLVEEAQGKPLLVAYWFQSTRERLLKAFPQAVAMSRDAREAAAWNRRELPMLLVHPQSAGHGLNLQFGGSHLVIVDLFHSLELYQQLVKRLDRPGQTETVVVHMLSTEGSMDEVVASRLERLADVQDAMFERLKALRRAALAEKGARV